MYYRDCRASCGTDDWQARNRTDQILNAFGMALFLGVAAYIVYKRTVGQFF